MTAPQTHAFELAAAIDLLSLGDAAAARQRARRAGRLAQSSGVSVFNGPFAPPHPLHSSWHVGWWERHDRQQEVT